MSENQTFNFTTLKPLLSADIAANNVPLLLGEAGIGKSSVLKALSQEMHTRVFTLSVNQLGSKEDLTGARSIKDDKYNTYRQIFFPHDSIQQAIDYANEHPDETPILFLDEINRTSEDVMSAALQLITERRVGTTNLPSNIRMVAAGNDQGNVYSFDTASLTRMIIYHVAPDAKQWLANQPEISPYISNVIQKHPELLVSLPKREEEMVDDDSDDETQAYEFMDSNQFQQLSVPRTLTYTSNFLKKLGFTHKFDKAEYDVFNEYVDLLPGPDDKDLLSMALESHVGNTNFKDELYDEMIDEYKANRSQAQTNPMQQQPQIKLVSAPSNDFLQAFSQATTIEDVNKSLNLLDQTQYQDFINWLFLADSIQTINENTKVTAVINSFDDRMQNVYHLAGLDSDMIQDTINILQSGKARSNVIDQIVDLGQTDSHPFSQQLGGIITAFK